MIDTIDHFLLNILSLILFLSFFLILNTKFYGLLLIPLLLSLLVHFSLLHVAVFLGSFPLTRQKYRHFKFNILFSPCFFLLNPWLALHSPKQESFMIMQKNEN